MLDKIFDIKRALESGAYLSALALTLTLPDICGKAAFPDLKIGERYRKWYDENIAKYDRRASCGFPVPEGKQAHCQNPNGRESCDVSVEPLTCPYYIDNGDVYFTADMCYQLRCAFLHSGSDNINEKNNLIDEFELQISNYGVETGGAHSLGCTWENDDYENRKRHIRLDITQFCFTVYTTAEVFYEKNKDKLNFKDAHIEVFDMNAAVAKMNKHRSNKED